MAEKSFREPRIALNRIYTRRGDGGQTSLAGGQRVAKDCVRIECYGTVDELNSAVGLASVSLGELIPGNAALSRLRNILLRVQHELFNLGSTLATLPADLRPGQAQVTEADTARLEAEMDEMNAALPELRSFVLPGGSRVNAELHLCRTICRRAERLAVALGREEDLPAEVVAYLNRLSDAFFVWSRWVNHVLGVAEVLWDPNAL